jgi:hypothetical protein
MLYYVETATTKRAYADQELKSWDGIKGSLPKATLDARAQKQAVVDAALVTERVKGKVSLKTPPKAVGDALTALKMAASTELSTHVLPTFDKQQAKIVDLQLTAPTYACQWDGTAPYVTTLVGTFPAGGITIMGWPQTDVPPDPA